MDWPVIKDFFFGDGIDGIEDIDCLCQPGEEEKKENDMVSSENNNNKNDHNKSGRDDTVSCSYDDDDDDNESSSFSSDDSDDSDLNDDNGIHNQDTWKDKMDAARKGHRPSLENWAQDGLAGVFPAWRDNLSDRYESFPEKNNNTVPVVLDGKSVSVKEFATVYEANDIPAIITNIPSGFDGGRATDPWPAVDHWDFRALADHPGLHHRKFKVGEDDDENIIKVKLKYFLQYMHANKDDSPLYIFCSRFDDDKYAKKILNDYRVPSYFRNDLFRFGPESKRPPYRWWLLGPERSGTCVHIDPLNTSAWNTLIRGKKRWVLFPPHLPKRVVKARGLYDDDEEDDEAIHYFMFLLPRIKEKAKQFMNGTAAAAAATTTKKKNNNDDEASDTVSTHSYSSSSSSDEEDEYADVIRNNLSVHDPRHPFYNFECYEFTQNEGETIFVPCGWWHAVLNLTDTAAITQNFCSPQNFDRVWTKTRTGRKKFAWKWLCALDRDERYRCFAERARELNRRDGFEMKYDPDVIARKEEERLREEESQTFKWKRRNEYKEKKKRHT